MKICKNIFATLLITFLMFFLFACGNKKLTKEEMVGTYINNYQEEIEGEIIDIQNKIVLNDDMTCIEDFQDVIEGKWDEDGNIYINDEKEHFEINNNKLILTRNDGYKIEFIKNNE